MRARRVPSGLLVSLLALAWAQVAQAGGTGFWQQIATPHRDEVERLLAEAGRLYANGAPQLAVAPARAATALDPRNYDTWRVLGEVCQRTRDGACAIDAFEKARGLARTPLDDAECSWSLGVEKSRLHRYDDAMADYDRQIRLGPSLNVVYANSAEVLMALGRLGEAEVRYREAIRLVGSLPPNGSMAEREQALALAHYGLAVALDRDEQPGAARDAMAVAVRSDPELGLLRGSLHGDSEIFFIPEGDVFYYLGLAEEAGGKNDEATAHFRQFAAALPDSPWRRRAQAHLAALGRPGVGPGPRPAAGADVGPPGAPGGAAHLRPRMVATVHTEGPVPAPLVDASIRERPALFDACGKDAGRLPGGGLRLSLELVIDGKGRVREASARRGEDREGALLRCIEREVKAGLRLTPPGGKKYTRARVELFFAP